MNVLRQENVKFIYDEVKDFDNDLYTAHNQITNIQYSTQLLKNYVVNSTKIIFIWKDTNSNMNLLLYLPLIINDNLDILQLTLSLITPSSVFKMTSFLTISSNLVFIYVFRIDNIFRNLNYLQHVFPLVSIFIKYLSLFIIEFVLSVVLITFNIIKPKMTNNRSKILVSIFILPQ